MLEEYALALEVGPSQVVQGERGLFVRIVGADVKVCVCEREVFVFVCGGLVDLGMMMLLVD